MGVRIEIPAVTWSAAYSNYNLADIYVSEDLMNTTSNLRYLAMPWINFCDIANAANDIGVDKEFASLTFPSSGSGCSAFKTKAVGGVPYNEYLTLYDPYGNEKTNDWVACTYNVSQYTNVSFRAFMIPKKPSVSHLSLPIKRREYQQLRRCHWFTSSIVGAWPPITTMDGPYQVIESVDSVLYDESNYQTILPHFCTLTGASYTIAAPASADGLLAARNIYVHVPYSFESIDPHVSSELSITYILDADQDITEGVAQDVFVSELNRQSPDVDGFYLSQMQQIIVGIPFYPQRILELSPMPSVVTSFASVNTTSSEMSASFDADGDLLPASPSVRRPWPNNAEDANGFALGQAGLAVGRYIVNVVENAILNKLTTAFIDLVEVKPLIYSRNVIGVDAAATCVVAMIRRRMACGSFDAGVALNPTLYFGGQSSLPYTSFIGRDSIEWNDIGVVGLTNTLEYSARQTYSYLSLRENVVNQTDIVSAASILAECPSLNILRIYAGRDMSNNVEAAAMETTGNVYGDWEYECSRATLDIYKQSRLLSLIDK